ncbi:conjugal transfer protein TraG N-terminal domain-containing protein (plasmid) [Aliarcobacter lanthieri]|uniref:conjugal transfer protein TraG N-terminal domain-containing protein n=1 Tax=Aliarcobacter lanthieri TaxID=1355374 RepID=UPI003AAF3F2A
MKKILILLLFLSVSLFASDDGWWIYAYEDISTLKAVFNYLAIIKSDKGYLSTINLVLIVGLTFIILMKFFDLMAIPKYLLSIIAILLLTFSSTTTVHIVNVKSYNSYNPSLNNYAVVDNVPFLFAVLSSAFSNIGYNSAVLIETIFTTIVDDDRIMEASFLKTGQNGAFKILEILDSINPLNQNSDAKSFTENFNSYLKLCVFNIGFAIDPRLKDELLNAPNPFIAVNPSDPIRTSINKISNQKVLDNEGQIITCGNLYQRANNYYNKIKNEPTIYNSAMEMISSVTSNGPEAASMVTQMMTKADLTNNQSMITSYIMNNGIRGAYQSALNSYSVGTSNVQAGFGAGLAEANFQAQGKIKAKAASSMIPSSHTVLQAVMYVLFPLILIVLLFSADIKLIKNYILGLVWLELWIPSFSVLSYFTLKEAQTGAFDKLIHSGVNNGPEGMLTLSNANEIYNTIANHASTAADMYWMAPMIAGFMLYASFQSLTNLTGGIAGLVSQYSNNQTLENERAKIAAFDSVNNEMQKNNPLYNGNVGTVSAMIAQSNTLSQASKAAADFLGTNSSVTDFNKLTRSNMFSGLESTVSATTREQSLTGGGTLSSGTGISENLASKKAHEDRGLSTAMNKNPNMIDMIESNSENSLSYDQTKIFSKFSNLGDRDNVASNIGRSEGLSETGKSSGIEQQSNNELKNAAETSQITSVSDQNAIKKHLQNNFGDLKTGAESIANVNKGSEISGLKKQITTVGSEENLIDVNSQQAAGKTSKEQSLQKELDSQGGYLKQMGESGEFEAQQLSGKNQAMHEIGKESIKQDSYVKTISSAGGSQGEINALESMKRTGLLDKDTSLYDKKVTDAGNFVAVDKDGNKITMYTDSKGNILGYEKQTIDKNANSGAGAGVRTIHSEDGKILSKIEEGSFQKNYQNTEDRRVGIDYTMENKGAAYKYLNEIFKIDIANAKTQIDKENITQKFLEDTRAVDLLSNPKESFKTIGKTEASGNGVTNLEILKQANEKADTWIAQNIPGGPTFVEASKKIDDFFGLGKK